MEIWQSILRQSIQSADKLAEHLPIDTEEVARTIRTYPMRINAYYLSLIKEESDPIWRQAIPDSRELIDESGFEDPLMEERDSPVVNLTHRYPDRVLLLVSSECAMYCRFCTRKRKVGTNLRVTDETIRQGLEYIQGHREIRDVILSGGDPLLLSDDRLEEIIGRVRAIKHVEIIRIGSRVPCTLPQRITPALTRMLKKYHPLYVNVHFNHPRELTEEAKAALNRLADAGIPLGNQSVLLRGVNDRVDILRELFCKLLVVRVKPYYLYLADAVRGAGHFRTSLSCGTQIMREIQGAISGMAVPTFVVDTPGGGGKVPVGPNHVLSKGEEEFVLTNYRGQILKCPEPQAYP
jgi:lysine 2,3-aminomutase